MVEIVAMIPARLGSKRIKHKNLRLLGGKPLVSHTLEKCKASGVFDEIYINSESEIFRALAEEYGVKFYKRNPIFSTDDATNDQFILDFVNNVKCDVVFQVNPTSPFVKADEIKAFVRKMLSGNFDTMLSVKREQVEGFYKWKQLNFDHMKQMPRSQDLEPIFLHCSTILAWKSKIIQEKMNDFDCCAYGADSKVGYFEFDSFANIDIDNEEDFVFAETIIKYLNEPEKNSEEYYDIGE